MKLLIFLFAMFLTVEFATAQYDPTPKTGKELFHGVIVYKKYDKFQKQNLWYAKNVHTGNVLLTVTVYNKEGPTEKRYFSILKGGDISLLMSEKDVVHVAKEKIEEN